MASKLRAQLLSEVHTLKDKLSTNETPFENNELWTIRLEFQKVCSRLLLTFLDFALENGVEKELWNVCFRNPISLIQAKSQQRTKNGQVMKDCLTWFLGTASGFYLQFFHNICSKYNLDFAFRKKDSMFGLMGGFLSESFDVEYTEKTMKSLMYLCQHCLIHLGDLSRYNHQMKHAEMFYKHALLVCPSSGHPYNQLSLLESARGNKLGAVCLHIKAICVESPFNGASLNLAQTLTKMFLISENEINNTEACLNKHQYVRLFLEFHYLILIKGAEQVAKSLLPRLSLTLSPLVATTALTRSNLLQMYIINIFSKNFFRKSIQFNVCEETNKKDADAFIDPNKFNGSQLVDDLIMNMLSSLLLPIYTIKEPSTALAFIGLPAVLILLEWLLSENFKATKDQQQIWPGICTLANILSKSLVEFNSNQYKTTPLPEHWDIRGFQPLAKVVSKYKFDINAISPSVDEIMLIRAYRIIEVTKLFCEQKTECGPVIKMVIGDDAAICFEAQAKPPVDDLRDLERLTLQPNITENTGKSKVGILKASISIEKKSAVESNLKENSETSKKVRTRSNVAMQAILKRNPQPETVKQVTFENVPSSAPGTETPKSTPPLFTSPEPHPNAFKDPNTTFTPRQFTSFNEPRPIQPLHTVIPVIRPLSYPLAPTWRNELPTTYPPSTSSFNLPWSTIRTNNNMVYPGVSFPPPVQPINPLFTRPPPPIREQSDVYPRHPHTENYEQGGQEPFRGTSTYSLFGPLGGGLEHGNTPTPQPTTQQPKANSQRLWAGPSPLQRLLEQKKFVSKSNQNN